MAVMGCVVNGPGESKHANLGISLPGTGESPAAPVYVDGEKRVTLRGERIAEEFQELVEQYVARRLPRARSRHERPGRQAAANRAKAAWRRLRRGTRMNCSLQLDPAVDPDATATSLHASSPSVTSTAP